MYRVESSIAVIRNTSERFKLPFVLGFSGGKDSTATLSLLLRAREHVNIERLYVVYADTLLEHPVLHKETLEALDSLKGMQGVFPVVLKPAIEEDYVSMVLDHGYPVPSWYFRWCVDRLKIRPVRKFMHSLGRAVRVLGVRADESEERKRTTAVKGTHPAFANGTLRPIIEWTEADVVNYLRSERRWDGKSFDYLIDLYGYEINDACTNTFCAVKPGATPYTTVRFGCWLCTVVRRNRMPVDPMLEEAREKLRAISDNPQNRTFINGKPRKLNERGKGEIAAVLLDVLEKEPEAFGYDLNVLKKKLTEAKK